MKKNFNEKGMLEMSFKLDSMKIELKQFNAGICWVDNTLKLEDAFSIYIERNINAYNGIVYVKNGVIEKITGFTSLTERQTKILNNKIQNAINELIKENKWGFETRVA